MRPVTLVGGLLALLVATACSNSDPEVPTKPVDTTQGIDEADCAGVLAGRELRDLAGDLSAVRLADASLDACQALGTEVSRIGLTRATAQQWVKAAMPSVQLALEAPSTEHDAVLQAALDRLREGQPVADPCGVFSAMAVAMLDQPAGTSYVVEGRRQGTLAVVDAQACSEDTFTSLRLEDTGDLPLTQDLLDRLRAAAEAVHPGPLNGEPKADPATTAPEPTQGAFEVVPACSLLDRDTTDELVGVEEPDLDSGSDRCLWDGGTSWLELVSERALAWSKGQAEAGDEHPGLHGCDLFAQLARERGRSDGVILDTVDGVIGKRVRVAHTCSEGRHTQLTVVVPDTEPLPADDRLVVVVGGAHARALSESR